METSPDIHPLPGPRFFDRAHPLLHGRFKNPTTNKVDEDTNYVLNSYAGHKTRDEA
jgi:hypothetical protein